MRSQCLNLRAHISYQLKSNIVIGKKSTDAEV